MFSLLITNTDSSVFGFSLVTSRWETLCLHLTVSVKIGCACVRAWQHMHSWTHTVITVCVFVYIFMKESARRAGMCLISCGQPAVRSLQDPSEVSASLRLPRASLLSLGDGYPQEWAEEGREDRCEHVLHNNAMSLWWWRINGKDLSGQRFFQRRN